MLRQLFSSALVLIFISSSAIAAGEPGSKELPNPNSETYKKIDQVIEVFEEIRARYVEEVVDEELLEDAIRGMLAGLDPHSVYIDAASFRELEIEQKGEYGGIGLEVVMDGGALRVVTPMDETPAAEAGITTGDFITHVDGEPVAGLNVNQAVSRLRGPVDTKVHVTIVRKGAEKPLEIDIVREVIKLKVVRYRLERGKIGYIRITTFNNERLSKDLERAVREIRKAAKGNVKGFVVDLRNNPGGLLRQAIEVADAFLERGEIVSMRGRTRDNNARWNASRGDLARGLPIVVLANAGSASAAEIVIGALQDHKRATIIGERTFGKGIVQSEIPLGPDSALRLTTARYYTPSGSAIQAKGIEPDIEVLALLPNGAVPSSRREQDLENHIEAETAEVETEETEPKTPAAPAAVIDRPLERPIPATIKNGAVIDYQLKYALDLLEGVIQAASGQAPAS
jgi:carboxyl-terminal processing protease